MRISLPSAGVLVLALLIPCAPDARAGDPGAVARGKYLYVAAGCGSCHGASGHDSAPSGGLGLDTEFGLFRVPNITPDRRNGIGAWSLADFRRALRDGIDPGGRYLYPVFPYPSFTRMRDSDIADLYAYLMSLPGLAVADKPHALKPPFGWRDLLVVWRALFFTPGPLVPDPAKDDAWNRGNYLVHGVAHCEECHTPRNSLGAVRSNLAFSGNIGGPAGENAPNITPDRETGIGDWSLADIETLLKTGSTPDSDFVGSGMRAVVRGTSQLSDADRHAIAVYLKTVMPVHVALPPAAPGG
jgi:mono/diheme cytochrome c family protein